MSTATVRLAAPAAAPPMKAGKSRSCSTSSAASPSHSGSARCGPPGVDDDIHGAFLELANLTAGSPRWRRLRNHLISAHLDVAEHIATRFTQRGQPDEDLRQVAMLGLVHAVDRFDPRYGSAFMAFAVPTMMGEVRRYFRDRTWSVRVPRRLQQLRISIARATDELAQELGHAPSARQLARRLEIGVDEVYEGLAASNAYHAASLDAEVGSEGDEAPMKALIGRDDAELERAEQYATVAPLLAELPDRQRRIVVLRFYRDLTQTQIAREVGISQMHVSRLLSKALEQLRNGLT